jgi:hypothetical protein
MADKKKTPDGSGAVLFFLVGVVLYSALNLFF